ncbi:hypothetical protein AB4238_22370 [Shewanella sp. 10N.286.45.A1]|uniref:hypothetical protein n=1 Tax=Shewanella sp. 10N.286.45.A1 TaxID=3229694 RepID=UPI00354B3281
MEIMDVKSWALIISLLAFTLSLITFFKTHIWRTLKFDCRIIDFSWKNNNGEKYYENRFFISSSGNQNIYIDKIYLTEGKSNSINNSSFVINVNRLLKPGEIEEVICKTDTYLLSHNKTYSFIFRIVSANTSQFYCSLQMSTKKQENNSSIVSPKSLGSGYFTLNTFNFWLNAKVLKNRRLRRQN